MSNTATATQLDTTATIEKRKGGRPVDPNSVTSRAMRILASIPADELNKEDAINRIVEETNCKKTSAMTYYYTYKASQKKA